MDDCGVLACAWLCSTTPALWCSSGSDAEFPWSGEAGKRKYVKKKTVDHHIISVIFCLLM